MKGKFQINNEGLEEYPWSVVICENLFFVAWIVMGTILCWKMSLILGVIYLAFSTTMILVVMRKLLCTRCYYYGKRCHVGWGIISAALFAKGDIIEFASCIGSKIPPILFGSLALIPFVISVFSIIRNPSINTGLMIAALVLSVVYSSVVLRKKSCSMCKMKFMCPGCAAK